MPEGRDIQRERDWVNKVSIVNVSDDVTEKKFESFCNVEFGSVGIDHAKLLPSKKEIINGVHTRRGNHCGAGLIFFNESVDFRKIEALVGKRVYFENQWVSVQLPRKKRTEDRDERQYERQGGDRDYRGRSRSPTHGRGRRNRSTSADSGRGGRGRSPRNRHNDNNSNRGYQGPSRDNHSTNDKDAATAGSGHMLGPQGGQQQQLGVGGLLGAPSNADVFVCVPWAAAGPDLMRDPRVVVARMAGPGLLRIEQPTAAPQQMQLAPQQPAIPQYIPQQQQAPLVPQPQFIQQEPMNPLLMAQAMVQQQQQQAPPQQQMIAPTLVQHTQLQ